MTEHKIEIWPIEKLIPYAANAKKHSDDQVAKLALAISTFNWTQPIVVWTNGEIIAGHGRRLAAIKLGLKVVPVICRSDLTKEQADALRLADNRVASTDYDQTAIQLELQRLDLLDFDLTTIGFDAKELDFGLGDLGEINDFDFVDNVSEAVEKQQSANEQSVKTTDDIAAPIGDAFGFKRVSIAQSRAIRDLVTKVESATGEVGAEALITFISDALQPK